MFMNGEADVVTPIERGSRVARDAREAPDSPRAPEVVPMYQGARLFCSGPHVYTKKSQTELAYIDILANSKTRFDSVKRMIQIQNIP